jgi:hypothetical protein
MSEEKDREVSRREFVQGTVSGLDGAIASFVEYLYALA